MLVVQDINVSYTYKTVLSNVSAFFEEGKVHLVLGENGAGKSTLAKVICGDIKPDSGKILLNGEEVSFSNPRDALKKGIGCVHQRPLLAESISIKENLLLGNRNIDYQRMEKLIAEYMPGRKSSDLASTLDCYERVALAMIGVLLKNPTVIILDEPSALLTDDQRIFITKKVREFVNKGNIAIVVSHFVKAALQFCDKVFLLKAGHILLSDDTKKVSFPQICQLLFEKEVKSDFEISWPKDLNVEFVKDQIDEKHFSRKSENGKKIGLIPSDRTFIGSNPNLTVLQLLTSLKIDLPQKQLEDYAQKLLEEAQVNITIKEKVSRLSGGMLQRLILQRELAEKPDILYLCDPLQGLDINGVEYLFQRLKELVNGGGRVIVQEAAS